MDNFTYDYEGNPVVGRPPRQARKKTKQNETSTSINPTSIFEIEGNTYDVLLEDDRISWESVAGKTKVKLKRSKSLTSLFKSKEKPKSSVESDNCLYYSDIIGVDPVYGSNHVTLPVLAENKGPCTGIRITIYEHKDENRLRDRQILLAHPSDQICNSWMQHIRDKLLAYEHRPKNLKVFLQPNAGKKFANSLYSSRIAPLFRAAGIKVDVCEIESATFIKHELKRIKLSDYDSIVTVGGDGTVNRLMNCLLDLAQEEQHVDIKIFSPAKSLIPIGIIPTGTTNHIVQSIQGTEDVITATIHIILGNKLPVNVTSIFNNDQFYMWMFNGHYGIFGNILNQHSKGLQIFEEKKIEDGLLKLLHKKKFRAYECDVEYILQQTVSHPNDNKICRKGCHVCSVDPLDSSQSSTYSDLVEELDPLAASNTSSIIMDLSKSDSPWKKIKGEFFNVSLFSLPGMTEYSPRGMSKYTHINDGALDLILVHKTDRKEFVRYLRRHGNKKNQFSFPFVSAQRCKEVKFSIRLKETWNHKDFTYDEINYEVQRQEKVQCTAKGSEVEIIDELEDSSDDESREDAITDDDDEWESSEEEEDGLTLRGSQASGINNGPTPTGSAKSRRASSSSAAENSRQGSGSYYKKTLVEIERERRKKEARKKAEKKRVKAETRMKSCWNIDNEIYHDLDLHFRCHMGLVQLHGAGISEKYEPDEVRMSCLNLYG